MMKAVLPKRKEVWISQMSESLQDSLGIVGKLVDEVDKILAVSVKEKKKPDF